MKPITPLDWMMSGDTGVSSKTIMHVMEGCKPPGFGADVPHDWADFGRCHRLLEAFPSYRERLHEMAGHYPMWGPLVREWGRLTEMYLNKDEGLYEAMRALIDEGRLAAGWTKTGPGSWRGPQKQQETTIGVVTISTP